MAQCIIWPSWPLKKKNRAGLNCWWNRWFQITRASVCWHCRKSLAHIHNRGGVWSSTSDVECMRRFLHSALPDAPTHHRSGRVMVEQRQPDAWTRSVSSTSSVRLHTAVPKCELGSALFVLEQEISQIPRKFLKSQGDKLKSEGDNLNAERFWRP